MFQGSAPKRENTIPQNPMRLLLLTEIVIVGCLYVIVPRPWMVASSCILVVCNKNFVSIQRIDAHVHRSRLPWVVEAGLRINAGGTLHSGVGCTCVLTLRDDVSVLNESILNDISHSEPPTSISRSHELHVIMTIVCFVLFTLSQEAIRTP